MSPGVNVVRGECHQGLLSPGVIVTRGDWSGVIVAGVIVPGVNVAKPRGRDVSDAETFFQRFSFFLLLYVVTLPGAAMDEVFL